MTDDPSQYGPDKFEPSTGRGYSELKSKLKDKPQNRRESQPATVEDVRTAATEVMVFVSYIAAILSIVMAAIATTLTGVVLATSAALLLALLGVAKHHGGVTARFWAAVPTLSDVNDRSPPLNEQEYSDGRSVVSDD